jgi:hypothetical protein
MPGFTCARGRISGFPAFGGVNSAADSVPTASNDPNTAKAKALGIPATSRIFI